MSEIEECEKSQCLNLPLKSVWEMTVWDLCVNESKVKMHNWFDIDLWKKQREQSYKKFGG